MKKIFHFLIIILVFPGLCNAQKTGKLRPNVLFIAVDDLRPELGCYGNTQIISPNIDRLAADGLVFRRAYCQQSICMASRASIMSGYRPDTLHIYNTRSLDELAPEVLTLNRHFENNGYQIWAAGKIYHHGIDHKKQFGNNYHEVVTKEKGRGYLTSEAWKIVNEFEKEYRKANNESAGGRGPAYEAANVDDNEYGDGKMTDMAVEKLADFKKDGKPFFMAVGFHKPHLPFNAPKKYWDLYDVNKINKAANPFKPEKASRFFEYNFGELRNYPGIPKGDEIFDASLSATLKHGYYACVSYTDAQIGRLIESLKQQGLYDNTIIILWGDHGWKLGEHGMWCKHTQFEVDNHVPLLLKVPGQKSKGSQVDGFVEFVDIYPTLCDLAGIEIPTHLQGESFAPLVEQPGRKWKAGAISYWPAAGRDNSAKQVMGVAIKTERYRYTEWIKVSTGEVVARDLFDHQLDSAENHGVAGNPENKKVMDELSLLLDKGKGWRTMNSVIR